MGVASLIAALLSLLLLPAGGQQVCASAAERPPAHARASFPCPDAVQLCWSQHSSSVAQACRELQRQVPATDRYAFARS